MTRRFFVTGPRSLILCTGLAALLLAGCVVPLSQIAAPAAVTHAIQVAEPAPVTFARQGNELWGLSAAEQLAIVRVPERDPIDIAHRLDPGVDSLLAADVTPAPAALGDRDAFWVLNSNSATLVPVDAELIYQNDRVNVWLQDGQPYDAGLIQRSADDFADTIYPALTALFGHENSPGIDGDDRIHMLFTTGMGGNVGGFFYSRDTVSQAVLANSNARELFFVNLDYVATALGNQRLNSLLAHEFQHMIHHAHDRNEETWVNEGMSEVAEDLSGFPAPENDFAWFVNASDTQLNAWNAEPGQNGAHYAAAYLFLGYLIEQLGPDSVRAILAEPADGIAGLRRVLAERGDGTSFESLFADWVVALATDYARALAHPGDYGFETSTFAADGEGSSVYNFATDFLPIDVALAPTGRIRFEGATESRVSAAGAASGATSWWSNRADMSDTRLTRVFDLSQIAPGQTVTATASLWWDIEEGFDFGYAMASRDGNDWEILPGLHSQFDATDVNALGPGYTGVSGDAGGDEPAWISETFDVSAYAGGPLHLRFEYITDDAVTRPGLHVDDVRIESIGYADDFESGATGWVSEGWLLSDGRLQQQWLLQLIEMAGDELAALHRFAVDAEGRAEIDLSDLDPATKKYLAISGLTEGTTEPAPYRLSLR